MLNCATIIYFYFTDVNIKSSALTKVISWVEEMNNNLDIPEKLRDILPMVNEGGDDKIINKYYHIGNQTDILTETEILEISQKAERNETGFTNFIRYTQEDYVRVLRKCL